MLKVCFISLKAYPLFKSDVKAMHGGAEVQMSILAKNLAQDKNFDVHVITASYNQTEKIKVQNITVWPSFNFVLFTFLKIIKFIKVLNKVDADIYIQRTLSFYSFFLAIICKLKKKKFIYMVAHDNELDGKEKLYKYPFGRRLVKSLFKKSSAVFVQNEYQENLFKKNFNCPQLVVMKKIAEIHEHAGIFDYFGNYDCVWLARAETWKQPEKFIELASMNPYKKFLMVCPELSKSYTSRKYKKLISKAYKLTNVTFITHLPYSQVFSVLRKCKVFCSTSVCEGDLPMSLLEAAIVGLPVLILSIDNYKSDPNSNIGIYCNNDINVMQDWLNKLLEDEVLYQEYSLMAKEYIEKFHNKEKIIPQFVHVLNTLQNN